MSAEAEEFILDRIPMTNRPANFLARLYGHIGIQSLAGDIPENGVVIDVGAGNSDFGSAIGERRPDVTVIELDRNFPIEPDTPRPVYNFGASRFKGVLGAAMEQAERSAGPAVQRFKPNRPSNVQLVRADIAQPPLDLVGTADRVFCWWLMPHFIYEGRQSALETGSLARRAAAGLLSLMNETGQLKVGPIKTGHPFTLRQHLTFKAADLASPGAKEQAIEAIIVASDRGLTSSRLEQSFRIRSQTTS